MSEKLNESIKVDMGLVPQTLATTNQIGRYFSLREWGEVLFVLAVGAMAKGKTAVLTIYKATTTAGANFVNMAGKEATITANENVTKAKIAIATRYKEVTVALASVANGEAITINGLTYTAHTDTTTVASRQFSIAGTNTQDADELASCINDATYGVPGVTATNNAGTITLELDDPTTGSIVASSAAGTFTITNTVSEGMQAGDTVTVNGVVFTAHATTTTAANREFAINGNDTADAAALATLINDATYGVSGVTATAGSGTITLTSTVPGKTTITVSSDADEAAVVVSTLEALAYVQVYAEDLGVNDSYMAVASRVETDASIIVNVLAIRGDGRYPAEQAVADAV